MAIFLAGSAFSAPAPVTVLLSDRQTAVTIFRDGVEQRVSSRSSLPLCVTPGEGFLSMNGRRWRGELIVERSERGGLRVMNRLPLEDYLKGVVPCEMPSNWPVEALKAQAVAARSYALGRIRRHLSFANRVGVATRRVATRRVETRRVATLQATVSDQVYRGASAESDTSNRAVEETAGEVLEFDGEPLTAYFHSACGGVAERPAEVWKNSAPADERWLAASAAAFSNDPDSWCSGSPHQSWRLRLTNRHLLAALRGLTPIRTLARIEVHDRTLSGRVARFTVTGRTAEGRTVTRLVDGQRLRMAVGPDRFKSLLGDLFRDGESTVFFGRGWGHGAGLCQWGARARAEAGASYREILRAYYPGAQLISDGHAIDDSDDIDTDLVETVSFPVEEN